jgi:hypothetical protein
MPTSAHETPLELLRLDPSLPDWVQTELLGDDPPAFDHARLHDPNVRTRTFQADAMILYCDRNDTPVRGTVYEVQRGRDGGKLRSWKLYVGHLETEFQITASLVVFVPDPAVARWYSDQIAADTHSGARLHPRFFTTADVPLVADTAAAATRPAPVLLAALCHLDDAGIDLMFPALLAALDALEPDKKIFYDDVTVGRLPESARARWEAFLMTTTVGRRYHSERYNEIDARGEARSVLLVLESRRVPVPDAIRERILACLDTEQLDLWLRRAATATTIDDLIQD